MANAVVTIALQNLGHAGPAGADTGQMRRRCQPFGLDVQHSIERAILGGAARAKGHRAIFWLELRQLPPRNPQFVGALGGFGRKEFKADGRLAHDVLSYLLITTGHLNTEHPLLARRQLHAAVSPMHVGHFKQTNAASIL